MTDASGKHRLHNDATVFPGRASSSTDASEPRVLVYNGRMVFSLDKPTKVKISVFDTRGAQVASPVDAVMPAGSHTVQLPSEKVANGTLLVRANVGDRRTEFRYVPFASGKFGGQYENDRASSLPKSRRWWILFGPARTAT